MPDELSQREYGFRVDTCVMLTLLAEGLRFATMTREQVADALERIAYTLDPGPSR